MSPSEVSLPQIAQRSRKLVEILSKEFPSRSGQRPEQLAKAAAFVEQELLSLGYVVESDVYSADTTPARNLIVEKKGLDTSKACIVLGAHYDTVVGTPGADDNASGIAGLIELARLFKDHPTKRTIRFVAFTHEEPPFFLTPLMGSRHYARRLKNEGTNIQVMLSLEMLGYGDHRFQQKYPYPLLRTIGRYPVNGNFIAIVSNLQTNKITKTIAEAMRQVCSIGVERLSAPGYLPPLFLSDHASFWRFGFPAVMVTDTAFLRNPHYHLVSDTADTLNYEFLAEVIKGLYAAVIALDKIN